MFGCGCVSTVLVGFGIQTPITKYLVLARAVLTEGAYKVRTVLVGVGGKLLLVACVLWVIGGGRIHRKHAIRKDWRLNDMRTGSWTGPPRGERAPKVGISPTVFGVRVVTEEGAYKVSAVIGKIRVWRRARGWSKLSSWRGSSDEGVWRRGHTK